MTVIIDVVEKSPEMSLQDKLLALNALFEAARSGESGKVFAAAVSEVEEAKTRNFDTT